MIMEAGAQEQVGPTDFPAQAIPSLAPNAVTPFDRSWPGAPVDPNNVMGKDFVYPGLEGLPFRGTPPTIKEDDPFEKRPQIGMQTHVRVLDMDDPADLKLYTDIAQLVADGVAQISFEERHWVESRETWKVLIRWIVSFYYMPNTTTIDKQGV